MMVHRIDVTNQLECRDSICIGIEIVKWCPGPAAFAVTEPLISPNPVSDHFSLRLPTRFQADPITIRILDTKGNLLFEEQRSSRERIDLDASFLSGGIYFLSIVGEAKNRLSKRFVKLE